jgi:hypothetical protein
VAPVLAEMFFHIVSFKEKLPNVLPEERWGSNGYIVAVKMLGVVSHYLNLKLFFCIPKVC